MTVRAMRPDEIDEAAHLLAATFDEDPMFRWLLPRDRARAAWLRLVMRSALADVLDGGEAVVTADTETGHLTAVAGLLPPRRRKAGVAGRLAMAARALRSAPAARPPLGFLVHGPRVLAAMARLHPRDAHVYLQVLGVHPAAKGRGLGGRLLGEVIERARTNGCYAYLETSNPANLGFYRRHGFELVATVDPCPGGGPPLWTMRTARDLRGGAPAH